MSIVLSMPNINRIGAVGICKAVAVANRTTKTAHGTPVTPLLANINVEGSAEGN
jgi:hypothetical protein